LDRQLKKISVVGLLCLAIFGGRPAAGEEATLFTYRSSESDWDPRYHYDFAVLRLALEKTVSKYGPYQLNPSPRMTFPRTIKAIENNQYPNFFVKLSYEQRLVSDLKFVFAKYPVDRGIVGYRVCFANPDSKQRLSTVKSVADLKNFVMGQGSGWSDVEILRSNGFKVVEVSQYKNLFPMVANNRFDLFCRGGNELLDEYEANKTIPNLVYDESMSLAYPMPRFFFGHSSNSKGAERIEEGLIAAHKDGSLVELWRRNYAASIEFVKYSRRTIYWIENPLLSGLKFDYRQYFFDPLREKK
jgi:hypothetical protein